MGRHNKWTASEVEYLKENWGYKPIQTIAKALGRSFHAVNVKAKRLKLGSAYSAGENLTARQVSYLLGVGVHTVTDYWISKCGLKSKYKTMTAERKVYLINFNELVIWLKNNPDKWDSRKIELYALGEEPEWLTKKREKDRRIPKRRFQKWTPYEDSKAIAMFKRGVVVKEIAEALNRSYSAVEHRLLRLDIWGTGNLKNKF